MYCGTGLIGLYLAKNYPDRSFLGIEVVESAVRDAFTNAKLNGIDNITFINEKSEELDGNFENCLLIVDPPRNGLSDAVKDRIIGLAPESIIYVSCNPFTLKRDLIFLSGNSYFLRKTVPINNFRRTSHVEVVSLLQRMSNIPSKQITLDVDDV